MVVLNQGPLAAMLNRQFKQVEAERKASPMAAASEMRVTNTVSLSNPNPGVAPSIPQIKPTAIEWAKLIGLRSQVQAVTHAPEVQALIEHVESILPEEPEVIVEIPEVAGDEYDPYADSEFDSYVDSRSDSEYDAYGSGDEDEIDIPDIMAGVRIVPDESQLAAVRGLARVSAGSLIGAAGTGKTTTTRLLLNTLMNGDAEHDIEPLRMKAVDLSAYRDFDDEESLDDTDRQKREDRQKLMIPSIAFVAFTGQATQVLKKNLPEGWRNNVMTIHSLLGYAPVEYIRADGKPGMRFEPSYTKLNKMPWQIIMIDEASMVGLDLWHQMIDASNPGTRFYFIGDLNQLPPSIGQGILGFALTKLPVFELTHVHRQSAAGANKIVDAAWNILQGKPPVFDDPSKDPHWRVIGVELPAKSADAHQKVIALCKGLSMQRLAAEVDPNRPFVYDPWRDRVLTQMNGFNPDDPTSLMGQSPLNDSLAAIFADPNEPRIVINAQKAIKKFAVGYRVMATKNESPSEVNRITNGMTGIIEDIEVNHKWAGDTRLVGLESDVAAARALMLETAVGQRNQSWNDLEEASSKLDEFTMHHVPEATEERNGGPASHIVTVRFDNGAHRVYSMNAQIEQLFIAYASTTHKAQGAEMPTVIIVVHHALKRMLTRENLYTAITRASQRVIILYTPYGMNIALANQTISGKTLAEKIVKYQRLLGEAEGSMGFKMMNVRFPGDAVQSQEIDFLNDDVA